MKIPLFQRKTGRSPTPEHQFRLTALRVSRFFENIREFYGLLDDGEEKSKGEYILDFQYVSSLVENILERLNMIVHDACILGPEGGEDLYLKLDSCTRLLKERFMAAPKEHLPNPGATDNNSPHAPEPEYVVLRNVLDCINQNESGSSLSCMQLLHDVLNHVFQKNLFVDIPHEKFPCVEIDHDGAKNMVSIVDLEEFPDRDATGSAVSVDTPASGLFGLITIGVDRKVRPQGGTAPGVNRWLAVTGSDILNLILTEPGGGLLVTVSSSGDPDSDFIFVLCGNRIPAEKLLPPGFRVEKTRFGSVACRYDASADEMDDYLSLLGNSLFGMSGSESLNQSD